VGPLPVSFFGHPFSFPKNDGERVEALKRSSFLTRTKNFCAVWRETIVSVSLAPIAWLDGHSKMSWFKVWEGKK